MRVRERPVIPRTLAAEGRRIDRAPFEGRSLRHGHAAYESISQHAIAAYQVYPGSRYDIYSRHYRKASTRALEWFTRHLRPFLGAQSKGGRWAERVAGAHG